ncbi:MAG: hypothetical protein ACI4WY_02565 [Anaerovoracaceae bacterium]
MASIDIELEKGIQASELIGMFKAIGWDYLDEQGEIFFLPIGDKDYDWQSEKMSRKEFRKIIKKKTENGETIGVSLLWKKSETGVNLLTFQEDRFTLMISINRKTLSDNSYFFPTDVNWYLQKILIPLQAKGLPVKGYAFSEYL